jgi:dTDP-L-rhamnose 4-epimerase
MRVLDLGRRPATELRDPVRVLLTGAAGFVGSAVWRLLGEEGHEVVAVDVLLPVAHRVAPDVPGLHRLDVRDVADWADLLDGVDVVSHQAAMVGAGTSVADLSAYAADGRHFHHGLVPSTGQQGCSSRQVR